MNNFNEIKDFMKKFNKVKFCEEENCILLKRSNYFKIIIRESDRNEIIILKKWNAGIIGKFLFKKFCGRVNNDHYLKNIIKNLKQY